MRKILLVGAGMSATSLIEYLKNQSEIYQWKISVGDLNIELAQKKCNKHQNLLPIFFDINQIESSRIIVESHDLVISLLPPFLHYKLAEICIEYSKHLVTASYVSNEMKHLNQQAIEKGIIFLNECGLDPGLDHMSAMKLMDEIREEGGDITTFKSYCGGLISHESDNNPWHYKFTWNPKNVILAGQSTAQYLKNSKIHYIPTHRIFKELEYINLDKFGIYQSYANRDSLAYIESYNLHQIKEIYRGTLRIPNFCESWYIITSLGLTDDHYQIDTQNISYAEWISLYLPIGISTLEDYITEIYSDDQKIIEKVKDAFRWLNLDQKFLPIGKFTPAELLLNLLIPLWKLNENDNDMVVMHHIIKYTKNNLQLIKKTTLKINGKDQSNTAMALTVGLPLGIAAKLILQNKIQSKGVQIPVKREFYLPILKELEDYNIIFEEQ